jgi:hypothetical protein
MNNIQNTWIELLTYEMQSVYEANPWISFKILESSDLRMRCRAYTKRIYSYESHSKFFNWATYIYVPFREDRHASHRFGQGIKYKRMYWRTREGEFAVLNDKCRVNPLPRGWADSVSPNKTWSCWFRKQVISLPFGLKQLKSPYFSCTRVCEFRLNLKAFLHVKVEVFFMVSKLQFSA